jgi:uncharacterized protein
MRILSLIALGVPSGALSGLTGMGGGAVIVPALIYLFGYSVYLAQGTTLAFLVPPIGILAAWAYYKHGYVNVQAATLMAIGFVIGSLLAAEIAIKLPPTLVRRISSVALGFIAIEMFLNLPHA